jgi:class 3 adenylate cyclase
MDSTSNRTFVCSVLFIDIVEYTKKSVTEQLKLKQRFNALLIQALGQVATSDRIVLDTGDGAAICFLGSPEAAMFVAMDLRDGIAGESPDTTPRLEVRMGANLGPIRLIKDINSQPNIIGDGINVAQRVMSFADAGAVLVSRSFFEVVSRLSDDYAQILSYEGSRTDKHVREHEVYAVGPSIPNRFADPPSSDGGPAADDKGPGGGEAVSPATRTGNRPGFSKKLLAGVSLLALAIIGAAVMLRMGRSGGGEESGSPPQAIAAAKSANAAAKSRTVGAGPAKDTAEPPKDAAKPAKDAAKPPKDLPAKATVLLLIAPWGEVYVDGQKRGISPPLKSLTLALGMHTVEIRNSSLPVHRETIDVKPGAQIKIKHTFR